MEVVIPNRAEVWKMGLGDGKNKSMRMYKYLSEVK